jgi:enoyl-CoA hydratase
VIVKPVVHVETEAGVRIVTIDRPKKRNALNATVRDELTAAIAGVEADPSTRVVVFTGAGDKAFIAGADVAEFAGRTPLEQRRAMASPNLFDRIWNLPLPTIALING